MLALMHQDSFKRAIAALLLSCVCFACGYRVIDGRGGLGVDFDRIEIRAFENRTSEPGLEQMLASALTEEFARRDWLTPVYSKGAAPGDLILVGVVQRVHVRPSSYSSVALALEDRIEISVDVEVRQAGSGDLVWEHPDLNVSELFQSSPEPQVYESNKEQAMRRVSALLSERIHDELFQRF